MSDLSKEKMKTIGLTGIMGAGKSSAIALLKECGVVVLDCDAINRQLLQKGEAGYRAIKETFGAAFFDSDGNLDTKTFSREIFQDEAKKKKLESLLHPLIKQQLQYELDNYHDQRFVVVEVPLLFEVQWEDAFDEVWVVSCQYETLLYRLQKYRHMTETEILDRLQYQIPQIEKEQKADIVLYNDQDRMYLKKQIEAQLHRLNSEEKETC